MSRGHSLPKNYKSLLDGQTSEFSDKSLWLLHTCLLKVAFGLARDQLPLVFVLKEALFQDPDSQYGQVDGLCITLKVELLKGLANVRVVNLTSLDAPGKHVARSTAPEAI